MVDLQALGLRAQNIPVLLHWQFADNQEQVKLTGSQDVAGYAASSAGAQTVHKAAGELATLLIEGNSP